METVFPEVTGLASFFLTAHRMTGGILELTGTVIVKRTYDVNPLDGRLTPAATALPIFDSDQMLETDDEIIQYEHDLAAFKPEADLIVWGFIGPIGLQRVRVGGTLWLSRTMPNPIPPEEVALFGWEPRIDSPRETDGNFPSDPAEYPLPAALPAGFNNRYYNGYRRDAAVAAPFPYFQAGASVAIERNGSQDYEVILGPEIVTATYYNYSGIGPDVERRWQPQPVTMQRDTVVITPGEDQCYVVWRGVWPFADHPDTAYRRLEVTLDENL
jgi:hypothetical protein